MSSYTLGSDRIFVVSSINANGSEETPKQFSGKSTNSLPFPAIIKYYFFPSFRFDNHYLFFQMISWKLDVTIPPLPLIKNMIQVRRLECQNTLVVCA